MQLSLSPPPSCKYCSFAPQLSSSVSLHLYHHPSPLRPLSPLSLPRSLVFISSSPFPPLASLSFYPNSSLPRSTTPSALSVQSCRASCAVAHVNHINLLINTHTHTRIHVLHIHTFKLQSFISSTLRDRSLVHTTIYNMMLQICGINTLIKQSSHCGIIVIKHFYSVTDNISSSSFTNHTLLC